MYKNIVLFLILASVIFIILIYSKSVILYHPNRPIPLKYNKFYKKISQLTDSEKNISNITVRTKDDLLLDTLYIVNPNTDKCIIFFHGNAGNLSMRFDMIKFLYNYASIIIFDYRSFGKSTGDNSNLSAHGLYTDADAIWNFAVDNLKIKPNNISLFGESIGCAVAIHHGSILSKTMDPNNYPHSLILNSPFYSLKSMIQHCCDKINIGIIGKILSLAIGNEYQSNESIKYINHQTKIIIAHSPRDEIVPYQEGKKLYDTIKNINPNVKFINIAGTHNNLGLTDHYIYALADAFE